jgi:Spy/CpxP family protein refolding chaperone
MTPAHLLVPRRALTAATAVLVVAATAGASLRLSAQGREWWRDAAIQQQLQLTSDQVASIDREFRRDLPERRRLHDELNRVDAEFRGAVAAGDEALATSLIPRLVALQAEQNTTRTRVLLRMSWVLTEEQRQLLRALRKARRPGRPPH